MKLILFSFIMEMNALPIWVEMVDNNSCHSANLDASQKELSFMSFCKEISSHFKSLTKIKYFFIVTQLAMITCKITTIATIMCRLYGIISKRAACTTFIKLTRENLTILTQNMITFRLCIMIRWHLQAMEREQLCQLRISLET